jgi:hypothetical protein
MKRTTKYVAFDVHQATTVASVREESGRVIARSVLPTDSGALTEFVRGMRGARHVTFEEGTQAQWLYELLAPLVDRVIVCDRRGAPRQGNKGDQVDADQLSELLRRGALRAVYHGSADRATRWGTSPRRQLPVPGQGCGGQSRNSRSPGQQSNRGTRLTLGPFAEPEQASGRPQGRVSDRTMVCARARPHVLAIRPVGPGARTTRRPMRKQTAPRTRKRRHVSSRKQPGLIAQDLSAPQSATPDSVLDNHSHRTRIRQNCINRIALLHLLSNLTIRARQNHLDWSV